MSQPYEKKCDCPQYNESSDHRSALIKMDDTEYEDNQFNSTSHIISRAFRFIGYVIVLVLLGYVLWRIRIIESSVLSNDRLFNLSNKLESGNLYHRRLTRSIKASNPAEHNSFGYGGKELARGGAMLTSKSEKAQSVKRTSARKDSFHLLVNGLLEKIWEMHNDTDRSHFDNNMKAVFQAWFPVFDALLPREFLDKEAARSARSADRLGEANSRADRGKREVDRRDKTIGKQHKNSIQIARKANEERSGVKKLRQDRSVGGGSEESADSADERDHRLRDIVGKNKDLSNEPSRRYLGGNEGSEESFEFKARSKNKANGRLMYRAMLPNQNGHANEISFG